MRHLTPRRLLGRVGVIAVVLAAGAGGFATPVLAGPANAASPVSSKPAAGTPHLVGTRTTETVRQLVKCGSMMYAVGSFTSISQGGKTSSRNNIFSFRATAPYTVTSWNPNVNGEVNSIAFSASRGCADAYIGGSFTSVHGTAATNIAEISTSTGAVVTSFGHNANSEVDTLLGYRNHMLAGGHFTTINGSSSDQYMASLNPSTGKDDGFLRLRISGHLGASPAKVYNQQLSHGGNLLLAEGSFTSVGGLPRQQIFMLNLGGSTAKVTGWTSSEFNQQCAQREAFYVRAAAWSPSDGTVYVATTGKRVFGSSGFPLTGLCDVAAAFPATQRSVSHKWIEYSGCDSYYSAAADSSAVYVAGHPRWAWNQNGCDHAGPGAIHDVGLQGLQPGDGHVIDNSSGQPRYSMSRANADDMLVTSAGLWIASSNRFGSSLCGGVGGHAGICYLPYR